LESDSVGESGGPQFSGVGHSGWQVVYPLDSVEVLFFSCFSVGCLKHRSHFRLNTPSTPSPVQTPDASRPASEEKPDLYCALANMSHPRCAVGCDNFLDTLLVCGKFFLFHQLFELFSKLISKPGGYDRTECLRSVEQYIPEINTWKPLPSMRENRGRFKIAVLNDKVYAIGGSNGTTELDSVEMLDLTKQEKWVKMPNLPLARSNMGVCTLDGLIYCIGGWNGQVGIKQCEVFDPVPSQWSSIASLNTGEWEEFITRPKCVEDVV
jgi:influenza virus NS1A-binding protein